MAAQPAVASSPNRAARAFTAAYLAYLNGEASVGQLPYATSQARAEALAGGPIAPGYRHRPLRLIAYHAPTASSTQQIEIAGDRRYRYPFEIRVTLSQRVWQVSELTPPDFTQDQLSAR